MVPFCIWGHFSYILNKGEEGYIKLIMKFVCMLTLITQYQKAQLRVLSNTLTSQSLNCLCYVIWWRHLLHFILAKPKCFCKDKNPYRGELP